MTPKTSVNALWAAAFLIVAPVTAHGQSELELISGGSTVVLTTGSPISYNGPVGGWVINVTAGTSSLGLDLTTVIAADITGTDPLEILLSSAFASTAGSYTATVSGQLGGPTTLNDTFSSYYGSSLLTTANPLTLGLGFNTSAFSGTDTGTSPGGTYLTAENIVAGDVPTSAFIVDFTLSGVGPASTIPDGGMTLVLLGAALAGTAWIRSKVSRQN